MTETSAREPSPSLEGVLETVLYFEDQDQAERFYTDVLGMRLIGKEPGYWLFFRAGKSVFLLFDATVTARGEGLPAHGTTGPGHVCFVVDRASYRAWKRWLEDHEVEILQEVSWPGADGERLSSFYFRDPDGNLLEIADGDLWPR